MRGFVGHVLDQRKTELVLQVGLPELLVVVDVFFVLWYQQFLRGVIDTPDGVVLNSASS